LLSSAAREPCLLTPVLRDRIATGDQRAFAIEDSVQMLIAMPPKQAMSPMMGHINGKRSIRLERSHSKLRRGLTGRDS